tara:strand:+ start:331 stop:681 length:351 start_codon:yes stop_codon:yes gene_type:complete
MGLLDRTKKKKEKEKEFLELGDDLDPMGGDYGPAGKPASKPVEGLNISGPPMGHAMGSPVQKDIEILESKLSALKSELEAVKQRLRFIENKLDVGEKEDMSHKYGTQAPKETGWHY